ncbi:MAG TPA: DUF192 domain-containing protein [Candidatus Acidoferrales bacterium]|nr:DUF192 domain-containing protein [Candidatus Acidoferrales bacterium]
MTGSLVDRGDGREVASRIVRAAGPLGRTVGLLGRASLEPGEGMWFDGCSSIHTFAMRTRIDVVFVDAGGRVVTIFERVPPWRAVAAPGARDVVELAPGTCAQAGLRPGASIEMRWHSPM